MGPQIIPPLSRPDDTYFMLSQLSGLSPLTPASRISPPAPVPPSVPDSFQPDSEPRQHPGHKVLAYSMLALTGLGALGGAGVQAAAHLPICQQTQQIVGWEHGQPCVSLDLGVQGATAWRFLDAPFQLNQQLNAWQSGHHQILAAPAHAPKLGEDDQLKVVSWNLHHGLSQDRTGARPQLDTMIDQLQHEDADVVLLQEVQPKDAPRLARELNMQGYLAMSTPVQGNLILLRPDIQVQDESITYTTGNPAGRTWDTLKDWVTQGSGAAEPRNLQILRVTMPDGQQGLIWNTHHLTGDYSQEQKAAAAQSALEALNSQARPGDLIVGGGDLNASNPDSPLIEGLQHWSGVTGHQKNIDWIFASDSTHAEASSEVVSQGGVMVSDHPLVRANLSLEQQG